MKVVLSVALVLILIVSVAFSETVIKEDVVKLNTTQPIQPKAPERRSSKYAKIKAAREAAERKLRELAAELESLKSAEISVPATKSEESSKAAPAPAPLQQGLAAPGLAAPSPNKLPSSEIVDMDEDLYMQRQNKAKYEIPSNQDKAHYSLKPPTKGSSSASELYVGHESEIPVQQTRRVVTKRVASSKAPTTKRAQAQAEWDLAHHDVHEYDCSHWVEIDGEMTRLHIKSQDQTAENLVYHGTEDEYAKLNGSHGHKIPDHEITRTKRRTNITKRPRRMTADELNGGFQAPQPTFYGMWTGENVTGGYKAPAPGVYGGSNKFKQGL